MGLNLGCMREGNGPVGVIDIQVGSGTKRSLGDYWIHCTGDAHEHSNGTGMAIALQPYESIMQKCKDDLAGDHHQIWFQSASKTGSTAQDFFEKIAQGIQHIKDKVIKSLLVGSFKEVRAGGYEMVSIKLGRKDADKDSDCFAELSDHFFQGRTPDDFKRSHADNLHEFVYAPECRRELEAFLGHTRGESSLATFCALNVVATNEEVHDWLKSIIRASLALHHRTFYAASEHTAGLHLPGDYVYFDKQSPWIHTPATAASASCFSVGAHGISVLQLRESKSSERARFFTDAGDLYIFSAEKEEALAVKLKQFGEGIADKDHTAIQKEARNLSSLKPGRYRVAILASDKKDLTGKLKNALEGMSKSKRSSPRSKNVVWNTSGVLEPKIAGLFPGQGAQHFNMLRTLCIRFPKVRDWFDHLDASLIAVKGILPSLTIFPPAGGKNAADRDLLLQNLQCQEGGGAAVIISSLAISELLRSLGCNVDVLVGHSSGEISAMFVSDILRFGSKAALLETILSVNKKGAGGDARGEIPKGRFLAVTAPDETVLNAYIRKNAGDVFLAMENCPQQKVLFFPNGNYNELQADLVGLGVICIPLHFERAYHTELFEPEMPSILSVYDSFVFYPPATPVFSCINLDYFPQNPEEIKKWAAMNWTHAVKFQQACRILADRGVNIFLEIGPGSGLSGFVDNTLTGMGHKALAFDKEDRDSYILLLNALANLFVEGVNVDLYELFEDGAAVSPVATALSMETEEQTQAPARRWNISDRSRSLLVQRHLDLMNEYLATEARVLHLMLKKDARQSGSLPVPGGAAFPMIDSIISRDSRACICKRVISVRKDLFLQHHSFGRFNLKRSPNAMPLLVVPLAMTIEVMAEAACMLAPDGYVVSEIVGLKASRWMKVENDSLSITLEANLISGSIDNVLEVFVKVAEEGQPEQPYCTATVVLKDRYPQACEPMPFAAEVPASSRWDAEGFFEQCLFHGEAFSCIHRLLRIGKSEIEVDLVAPRKDMLFSGSEYPEFRTPAQLLDVPGHAAAYWKVEMGDKCFGLYPVSVSRIQFFGPPAAPLVQFIGRAVNKVNGTFMDTEVEVLNRDGSAVYMRISGFKTMYHKLEASLLRSCYWMGPNSYFCNEIMLDDPRIIGLEAGTVKGGFQEQEDGIWLLTLVYMYCNEKEKHDWRSLPAKGKRKVEWLLGRVAAKEIVRKWAFCMHGVYVLGPDIEIAYDTHGRPFAICPDLDRFGPLPDISITHSNMQAIAVAVSPGSKVGVDLEYFSGQTEKDRTASNRGLAIAFSDEELALIQEDGNFDLHSLVSAKEAATKAIGLGLLNNMKRWKIKRCSTNEVRIEAMEEEIPVMLQRTKERVVSYCILQKDVALRIKEETLTINHK